MNSEVVALQSSMNNVFNMQIEVSERFNDMMAAKRESSIRCDYDSETEPLFDDGVYADA